MPASGDLLGPYRLVSELGKGAMGEVWRARDERLDRYVALKVLPADLAGDVERRARMLREARAAAAIRHPNVVTLFDIVSHEGDDILVMELVEGRTLSDYLRKQGPPPLELALRWLEQLSGALAAAHARGILHRDIKSANVMVSGDDLKVLDFGLAKLGSDAPEPVATSSVRMRSHSSQREIALEETMASKPAVGKPDATVPAGFDLASYRTHAGQLLGTPLYMAPEQIDGAAPDERSEVFSVGVLAYELLHGKAPYTATTMDALFTEISSTEPPPLETVPGPVSEIVMRALAKSPTDRWPTMAAMRDAIAHERKERFAPRRRMWPVMAGVVMAAAATVGVVMLTRKDGPAPPPPPRPGDEYVKRALEEYDVFYTDKAMSSLRAALAAAPEHPRANAYLVLFGGGTDADRAKAVDTAIKAREATPVRSKDRALLDAAIALVEHDPMVARTALVAVGAPADRELAFWDAELAYRAGLYEAAGSAFKATLALPGESFRGRIYDHYSSVLLYLDDPTEALRIGTLYQQAFPGEADAIGVYATTLAAAGRYPEAIAAAEEAVRLSEGEDTLAGLGKVLALSGDRARAKDLYQRSLDRAGPSRRPMRRAALALLQWADGEREPAIRTIDPCLPGGADSSARERGACLFVAGVMGHRRDEALAQLDVLHPDSDDEPPPYGSPISLRLLVMRANEFLAGGCIVDPTRKDLQPYRADHVIGPPTEYEGAVDFYAAYHVPFFATWAVCEEAALLAAQGKRAEAAALLRPVAERAPGRTWLLAALKRYEN